MSQESILVCSVDFSDISDGALDYALSLARDLGASVHLVHAYYLPVYAFPQAAPLPTPEMVREIDNALGKAMAELVAAREGKGVALETHLTEGLPHERIIAIAQEVGAELIVMGTRGRTGLAHALMGSVAERVIRASPIPVLTVPKGK